MDMEELLDLLHEYKATGAGARMAAARKLELLKLMRKKGVRMPSVAIECGQSCLKSKSADEEEALVVREQVCVAAMDQGDVSLAEECLRELTRRFSSGSSTRVKRLLGMLEEARGDYTAALAIYKEILDANPANLLVQKRKVSVLKAQGNIHGAIAEMLEILKSYQCDGPLWHELGETYVSVGDYSSAAFCYEEMILAQPGNPVLHTRLGELYYTSAGLVDSSTPVSAALSITPTLVKARKHFCMSLDLQRKRNLRATLGLLQTCESLLALPVPTTSKGGGDGIERQVTSQLLALCVSQLSKDACVSIGMPQELAALFESAVRPT